MASVKNGSIEKHYYNGDLLALLIQLKNLNAFFAVK
jgi:hypothetical protein